MERKRSLLDDLFNKTAANKKFINLVLTVHSGDEAFQWSSAGGSAQPDTQMRIDSPYFIASVTKIYTATAVMLLHEQKLLDLEAPLRDYLPAKDIQGLHIFKHKDYSADLRVFHLLGHTSGLADYFEQKDRKGNSLFNTLLTKGDVLWDYEQVLKRVKQEMSPKFPPASDSGTKHKGNYSDTNYQLLGRILENLYNKGLGQIFNDLFFSPLEMKSSYLYGDDVLDVTREVPAMIHYKDRPLNIPQAMASFGPDGAIVSNVEDQIIFLKSLFSHRIFKDRNTLKLMQQWNRIFFPMQYGYGLMHYQLPRALTLFRQMPELIGHSGASGSFSFYCPKHDIYMAGTLNQLNATSAPFILMPKIVDIFS